MMQVTTIAAGLLGILLLVLGSRVVAIRGRKRISIGDGGDPTLALRIRSHANFAEHAPLGLLLLFLAEQAHGASWFVIALAAMLVAGRFLHPVGMELPAPNAARVVAMVLTWSAIGILAILLLVEGVGRCAACTGGA